jgi:hypothetical protein
VKLLGQHDVRLSGGDLGTFTVATTGSSGGETGLRAFLNQTSFELSECRENVEDQFSGSAGSDIHCVYACSAIVYAACMVATRIVNDQPELAAAWLTDGRQKINPRILHWASERLDDLFDRWWDEGWRFKVQ